MDEMSSPFPVEPRNEPELALDSKDSVGFKVVFPVGTKFGAITGSGDGSTSSKPVGLLVDEGLLVGGKVGSNVGLEVGTKVGPDVGKRVGLLVGAKVVANVGLEVGSEVEPGVGE